MTPFGIEPATFRFVAQRLNHCATAVLNEYCELFTVFCEVSTVLCVLQLSILYYEICTVFCDVGNVLCGLLFHIVYCDK
jgi:hypothetical protein